MFADVYIYRSVGVYMNIGVGIYTDWCMYIMFLHVIHFDIMVKKSGCFIYEEPF